MRAVAADAVVGREHEHDLAFDLAACLVDLDTRASAPELFAAAKLHLLDTLGVALGGSQTPHARSAVQAIRTIGSDGPCTVLANPGRAGLLDAMFLNGVMAHGIDFDDSHRFVHPGCAVIPAALAAAEKFGCTGKRFLQAIAAGYEASVRVSLAAGPPHRHRGYHPTGTCNVFGAAAASGLVMGLSGRQLASALAIAASQAGGLTQYRMDGSPTKHLHAGFAARGGGLSAVLAQSGLAGPTGAFEGELGFLAVLADGGDPSQLRVDEGPFRSICETDMKPYPSCRQTHAPVDLALRIREQGVRGPDIASIVLRTYAYNDKPWHTKTTSPASPLEAMLNIPYCVATALAVGQLTLRDFEPSALARRATLDLLGRIEILVDETLTRAWPDQRGADLLVTDHAGTRYRLKTDNPRGGNEDPLTEDDIRRKFLDLAMFVVGRRRAHQIIDVVQDLERRATMDDLAKLLHHTS